MCELSLRIAGSYRSFETAPATTRLITADLRHLWFFRFIEMGEIDLNAGSEEVREGTMKNAVLILTNSTDSGTDLVIERIRTAEVTVHRFDTETFPIQTLLTLKRKADKIVGRLTLGGSSVDLETIKSVWYRRPRPADVSSIAHSGVGRFIRDEASAALWSFYTTSNAYWMNPPLIGSVLVEHNKLLQLQIAAELGLQVPDTIITNDSSELIEFCRQKGGVIAIKLLKGNHFRRPGNEQLSLVYTQRITESALLKHRREIALSPVFAQEYVEKDYELRITFVAGRFYSCAIYSQPSNRSRTDWRRYDLENVRHTTYLLPPTIHQLLTSLMTKLGLNFGAIDMIRTPKGSYVFLEVNQGGEWQWIEKLTGLPIADAIANALIKTPEIGEAEKP